VPVVQRPAQPCCPLPPHTHSPSPTTMSAYAYKAAFKPNSFAKDIMSTMLNPPQLTGELTKMGEIAERRKSREKGKGDRCVLFR